ncbi:Peroxisomal 2,4-dienoyl-CoA reductase [Capsicum baccatum]|uniref:2,4-dienoyl-CoA reductase [(3E)-enoyl-CoA-producing] n=1 Tax=Capsicum baccatum TaxID=33114 RepID=A0A2G2VZV3_CAPBA|nr:Peroxisomal 2,4-dienoyl-CoA reductase [Capsicum baccatum]
MYNDKSRHISRSHNTVRELLSSEIITVDHAKSKDNVSDLLTKGLSKEGVKRLSKKMGLQPRTSHHGVLDIDSVGTFTMSHEALNYIKKGGPKRSSTSSGLILNISATLHYTASWYQIYVAIAKAIVDAFTRNLALEWGTDYDIKVNGIAQGSIGDTAGMHKLGSEEISNKSR